MTGRPRGHRQPLDDYWVQKMNSLFENAPDLVDREIADRMKAEGGEGRTDYPAIRTVAKYRAAYNNKSAHEKVGYRTFHWPESMERRDLPWEASAACLELLGLSLDSPYGRPSIRVGRWYWRLSLAAPDLPAIEPPDWGVNDWTMPVFRAYQTLPPPPGMDWSLSLGSAFRFTAAHYLAGWEAADELTTERLHGIEGFYAFAPWRGGANLTNYCEAIKARTVPPLPAPSRFSAPGTYGLSAPDRTFREETIGRERAEAAQALLKEQIKGDVSLLTLKAAAAVGIRPLP